MEFTLKWILQHKQTNILIKIKKDLHHILDVILYKCEEINFHTNNGEKNE